MTDDIRYIAWLKAQVIVIPPDNRPTKVTTDINGNRIITTVR